MALRPIKLLIYIALSAGIAGCATDQTVRQSDNTPPVTGPFDLYFPNAAEVFSGAPQVNQSAELTKKTKENHQIVPEKGALNIGLLVPKSGGNAQLGKDFEDAAVLALYDAKLSYPGGYRITLIPKDTAGSPSVAVSEASMLKSSGTNIFIGPLYAESTEAVSVNVNPTLMISLSNNIKAAKENAFIYGFTPESEMERALTYGLKQDHHHVSAILPNNAYGHKLEQTIRNTVPGFGASLDAVEFYVPTEDGRIAAATRLANRLRQINTGILCFGDNKEETAQILAELQKNGMDVSSILKVGTSLWHQSPTATAASMNHAVYAGLDQRSYTRFMKRFKSAYGRLPSRVAVLAYDAVTLLAQIASRGNIPSRQDLMALEIVINGASGPYRFETDGTLTRGLALYKLTATDYKVIENAPKSF